MTTQLNINSKKNKHENAVRVENYRKSSSPADLSLHPTPPADSHQKCDIFEKFNCKHNKAKGDVALRTEIQKLSNFSNFKPVAC